jgi:hypothetical protein
LGKFRFGAFFDPLTCENECGNSRGSIEKHGCMLLIIIY